MAHHHHRSRRSDEDERDHDEDEWDRTDKHHRRHVRFAAYLPYAVFILLFLGIVFGVVYLFFTPDSADQRKRQMAKENSSSFTDRATALKILELMEARRDSEAATLAESIAEKVPGIDRDIAHQINQRPGELRRWLETYINSWINIEHAAATQTTLSRRAGYPAASTPEVVVLFLCDYANYRARNFAPAPREINDDLLGRIFLQAADEKYRRLAAQGEKPF